MQNLGQQKNRCYWLTLSDKTVPAINTHVFNGEGKSVGEIIQAQSNPFTNTVECLAVLRINVAESGTAYLTADQQQALQVHELPYPIDPKQELQH